MAVALVVASTFEVFSWGGVASSAQVSQTGRAGTDNAFTDPQMVTVRGYSGSAMEPFISVDGRYLLFNTSNVAPSIPALKFATRIGADTFRYRGEVEGANQFGYLSGTPSMDESGNLYFVSTRSYAHTLSTVYSGHFASGTVTGLHLVPGISGGTRGTIDFDVEVSPDGSTLYVSVGHFDGGPPTSATLVLFDKVGNSFVPDPHSAKILRAVNEAGVLTYAASISTNGLELFFTRANPEGGDPAIYRAVRSKVGRAFGHVRRVGAATGFVEAPAINADNTTLYYHKLVGRTFQIWTVTRPKAVSGRSSPATDRPVAGCSFEPPILCPRIPMARTPAAPHSHTCRSAVVDRRRRWPHASGLQTNPRSSAPFRQKNRS